MEPFYNGSESAGEILVVVSVLTGELSAPVVVRLSTMDDTAQSPADYQSVNQTLTFTPDQTTLTISVPVTDDEIDEDDENILAELDLEPGLGDQNVQIQPDQATLLIVDDDG